jgi:hypothetical protein
MMGRVMSIDYFGSGLLLPLAPVLFAVVTSIVGPAQAFVFGGALAALVAAALLLVPSIRALE